MSLPSPNLIPGGRHVDQRGAVSFVNGFDFKRADRFFWIQSAEGRIPRGWVGHQREQKWFCGISGEVLIFVVKPDNWESPSRELTVTRYLLSSEDPKVLHVPPGYATASVNLDANAILMVFSSGAVKDTGTDDFRFPIEYWQIDLKLDR